MIYRKPRFLPGGDRALFVELGDAIDPAINRRVRNLMLAIQKEKVSCVIEAVPTYRSLLVYFDPQQTKAKALQHTLSELGQHLGEIDLPAPKLIEIPTVYGGDHGPDLDFVAAHNGLSTDEVIRIHDGTPYLVYMLGFMPGFPYLGGMSARITAPHGGAGFGGHCWQPDRHLPDGEPWRLAHHRQDAPETV
jgi:inhibitor of KinA